MPDHCVLPSALTTITRTVTVAAGRFAPGHLGGLTAVVPFELVDAVLAETSQSPALPPASRDDRYTAPAARRRHRILALLQEDPTRLWQPRDIAAHFGDITLETMYRQLNRWAASGLIHKLGPRPLRRNTVVSSLTCMTCENANYPALEVSP